MADVAAAWRRVAAVLKRRPKTGLQEDSPAKAQWQAGTQVISVHANGTTVLTDMPAELGGDGKGITPGWLLRAGLASCAATTIAMAAAAEGIELSTLELVATSRSDTRGLFGMADTDGKPVSAGPLRVQLEVRIAAHDVCAERLMSLVRESHRRSPVSCALQEAIPVELRVEVATI